MTIVLSNSHCKSFSVGAKVKIVYSSLKRNLSKATVLGFIRAHGPNKMIIFSPRRIGLRLNHPSTVIKLSHSVPLVVSRAGSGSTFSKIQRRLDHAVKRLDGSLDREELPRGVW